MPYTSSLVNHVDNFSPRLQGGHLSKGLRLDVGALETYWLPLAAGDREVLKRE